MDRTAISGIPDDLAGIVDSPGRGKDGARHVNGGEGACSGKKAMVASAVVKLTYNLASVVDAIDKGRARTGHVEDC